MQYLQPIIQPIASYILQVLIGLIVTYLLLILTPIWKKIDAWLKARTTAADYETMHKVARDAFAHAETVWLSCGGAQKLQGALDYANLQLNGIGTKITQGEIIAAIHDAWLQYDLAQKAAGLKAPAPQPVKEIIPPEAQQLIDAAKAYASGQQQGVGIISGGTAPVTMNNDQAPV